MKRNKYEWELGPNSFLKTEFIFIGLTFEQKKARIETIIIDLRKVYGKSKVKIIRNGDIETSPSCQATLAKFGHILYQKNVKIKKR